MSTRPRRLPIAIVIASALFACSDPAPAPLVRASFSRTGAALPEAVYVQTNASASNAVLVYSYDRDERLVAFDRAATGGQGVGGGPLLSQGSVAMSADKRWLFVANAGSNEVSLMRVRPSGLALADVEPSGGVMPLSVAVYEDLVYVLNAGVPNSVVGFRVSRDGDLVPIPNSLRMLSGPDTGPTQVGFSPDGKLLVVTEQRTARITTFIVRPSGFLSAPRPQEAGAEVNSFAFDGAGRLIATVRLIESGDGGVAAFELSERGEITAIGVPLPSAVQGPVCWIAITPDGRVIFTSAPPAAVVTSYTYANGNLIRLASVAAQTGEGSMPVDLAVSADSR